MNKKIAIGSIAFGLLCMAFATFIWMQQPKTAYVNLNKIFESFDGKKELESRLKSIQLRQQSDLDSLNLKLEFLQRELIEGADSQRKLLYQKEYANCKMAVNSIMEQQQGASQEFTSNIWKQIDQYVSDYGKENSYDYIHGGNGNGSLMHVSDQYDITDEVILFINAKYAGVQP